jgi:hypothetical protein
MLKKSYLCCQTQWYPVVKLHCNITKNKVVLVTVKVSLHLPSFIIPRF